MATQLYINKNCMCIDCSHYQRFLKREWGKCELLKDEQQGVDVVPNGHRCIKYKHK